MCVFGQPRQLLGVLVIERDVEAFHCARDASDVLLGEIELVAPLADVGSDQRVFPNRTRNSRSPPLICEGDGKGLVVVRRVAGR
jgi:hypothetical protein